MGRQLLTFSVVLLLVGTAFGASVTAATPSEEATESQYHVEVSADGDAVFSLVTVYDLTDDDERAAFASLEDDEEAKAELLTRFEDRMASVADTTGADGDAVIGGESIELHTTGDRAIVTLSVTWDEMADSDGETVTLTEPFASGFEPDRTLVVSGPEESSVASATPDPAETDGAVATWPAGTELDGFEVVLSMDEADGGAGEASEDELPGFGITAALLALASGLAVVLHARREPVE